MINCVPLSAINDAIVAVAAELPARIRNAVHWRQKSESELWRELVAAILGSAVSYEMAISALRVLDANGLTMPSRELGERSDEIERLLRCARYRFPAIRARQVAGSAAAVYANSSTLRMMLDTHSDAVGMRRGLVELCPGLGPKQASLFLRNIGYTNLAILDRHVLAYLQRRGLLVGPIQTISSVKKYEVMEQVVFDVAAELGLSVGDFDLSVWITVRTASGVKWPRES
jgi:N-glycosylase/DNA lyase